MVHRHRFVRALAVACVAAATGVVGVVAAPSASAATTTRTAKTFVFGSTSFQDLALTETSLSGVDVSAGALDGSIDWIQTTTLSTQYDTDDVRRGQSVDPTTGVTRTAAGFMTVNWLLPDFKVQWPGYGQFDVGTVGFGAVGACDLRFGGAAYVCHVESANAPILDSNPDPGPYVNGKLAADLTITPQAMATLRTASYAGTPGGTADLALGESGVTDALSVACTVEPGAHLSYALGSLSTTPGVSVQANLVLEVGSSTANPAYPATDPDHPVLYQPPFATPSFPFAPASSNVTLTGSGKTFDLGAVQENEDAPVADAGGPYTGVEGASVTFDGSGSTAGGCGGTPTLAWEFSDGGSATGPNPQHTFADDGTYSGTLTATDSGGQSATSTFSVTVTNQAPTVDAGVGVAGVWGHSFGFAGSATDPSAVDQATLAYTWDFGDGTPTAAGANATHTYASPSPVGGYQATLTVCDKDGGCASDVRPVSVAKRDTALTYQGDLSSLPNKTVALRAVLVDENGVALAGRRVEFTLGSQSASGVTDANGVVVADLKLSQKEQKKGVYPLTASYSPAASDAALYEASIDEAEFKLQVK